jgi:hypothetical protein
MHLVVGIIGIAAALVLDKGEPSELLDRVRLVGLRLQLTAGLRQFEELECRI